MRIVIPEDYQQAVRGLDCFARLQGHDVRVLDQPLQDPDATAAALADAQALVLIRERTRIDEALLARLPQLRLISQTGRLSSNIDLDACTRHGVSVAEGSGSPVAPAELAWALVMAASRRLRAYGDALHAGRWQSTGDATLGRVLRGRTLGIWSYGKIGKLVAGYGQAFGMRVLVWGSEASCAQARTDGYEVANSRAQLFAESDVFSLHRRLSDASRHEVRPEDLARMRPDTLLVNTSRAELIAPGALLAALDAGRPGMAAVDVFEHEPLLDAFDPLLTHPRVLATPHLGYVERDSYEQYFSIAFDNVLAFAAGAPKNIANPQVLGR
ncbi:3-phosphoglycerate dehydrogenase [Stenotrophomonas panacihumi]|uniref:3-phosphoglycerate dehydrogenase n=1 Tax=Stenotrophomonas panacihumi TaxID=676599 RepID=A0A0Q9ZYQ7_9GAMM|nr:D-2-hydroxyacid dehydrogenase family protein [Stenotrophomonas panacihumi]KRG37721.1 3-phosphoglycerate dehydrogenase [Stenotrophomonas panacihumi]PTN56103.1 D-2-hydroxyacid dehydrogenase family protein [Stenotrophomonas panacihumi]